MAKAKYSTAVDLPRKQRDGRTDSKVRKVNTNYVMDQTIRNTLRYTVLVRQHEIYVTTVDTSSTGTRILPPPMHVATLTRIVAL